MQRPRQVQGEGIVQTDVRGHRQVRIGQGQGVHRDRLGEQAVNLVGILAHDVQGGTVRVVHRDERHTAGVGDHRGGGVFEALGPDLDAGLRVNPLGIQDGDRDVRVSPLKTVLCKCSFACVLCGAEEDVG